MNATRIADQFLYERLSALAPTFSGTVPDGESYPLIVFHPVEAADRTVQGHRHTSEVDYTVFARALAWAYPLSLQEAIDAALNEQRDASDDFTVFCARLSPLVRADRMGETPIRDAGGIYRVTVTLAL